MSTPPVNSCNSSAGLIEKYINSAYDNVKAVADNLDYLDQIYQFLLQYGLITNIAVKAPVQAVATSPITLSGNQVLTWSAHSGDYSVLATTGMRVLVLGQTNPVENGIYDVQNNAWTRSVDFDGPKDVVDGTLVFSSQGDVWQVDGPQYSLVPGTDPIVFRDIDLFAYEALREATEKAQEAAASAAAALASEQAAKVSEDNAASSEANASNNAAAAFVSETNAKVSEDATKVSENNAKASELAAQNSASLAESVTNNTLTFSTTAAGIAGTTNGQYFRVPQGSGATLSFIYYLNNSGTAQVVAEMPGKGAITNNIRSYSSLAVAQADVTAGNILNGAYCYVRNDTDEALADEYINNNGTLTATGRKMLSYSMLEAISQAVTAEIMARTGLIASTDSQVMISLCDEWGYEFGRIADNSFETVKLKLIQSDTGPLLMLTDEFGNAVNLFSEKGALMAGDSEISDSESLISFPDEFGNELILVDKQGRLRAGDNIIFDTPDWARCTVDPFGYVIEGVKLNGDVVSKNGGGSSGEPVPSVLETSAVAHWLFGYESTSYASRVGNKTLTPQSAPEFNSNYISIPAWGGALMTDIPDSGEYTVCAVVRVPAQADQTDCVVIYGTQNGYSLRADDDTYTGNQLSLLSDREGRRWIYSKISGYRSTSRNYPTRQPPIDQWLFVTHVVKLTGNDLRYQVISVGGENYQMLREADSDKLILSGRNIAVGNGYCDVSAFKTKGLDIAEFIYFNRALSSQEVKSVYLNSRQRMSERALNLQ